MLMLGYGRADASDGRAFPYAFPLVTNLLSQASAQIRFIGQREGGMHRLRGKRITYLYLDVAHRSRSNRPAPADGRTARLRARDDRRADSRASSSDPTGSASEATMPDWVLLAAPGAHDTGGAAGCRTGRLHRRADRRLRAQRLRSRCAARGSRSARLHRGGAQSLRDELPGRARDRPPCVRRPGIRAGARRPHRRQRVVQPRRDPGHPGGGGDADRAERSSGRARSPARSCVSAWSGSSSTRPGWRSSAHSNCCHRSRSRAPTTKAAGRSSSSSGSAGAGA